MGRGPMRTVRRTLAGIALLLAHGGWAVEPPAAVVASHLAGQSIYRDGLLLSGEPVRAVVQKGVVLSGAEAACVNCHRRSGLGGSEGQTPVRPIAGRLLFTSSQTRRARRWKGTTGAAARPAYTRADLARALRDGIDPNGRVLDPLMPRYALSDAEVDQIHAYLAGLSSAAAPGVDDREIHFATIIAPGVDTGRRRAMLDVLQAFFRDKNGGTRKETRRREAGSEQMYLAYRTWVLHAWELRGAPETWRAQIDAHYRRQPVFAVIGGLGDAGWQPVHAFCESTGVPCVFRDVETGRLTAQALRAVLQRRGIEDIVDYPVAADGRVAAEIWSVLLHDERPSTLVAWLHPKDVQALGEAGDIPAGLTHIYVSASLSAMRPPDLPEPWLNKLRMVYPFVLPGDRERRLARVNAWLRARNMPLADARTQANAFFAATVTGDAMSHLGENFSRDYFIERIEQMAGSSLSSSMYPRLSLGPGQRFASRGGYILGFPQGAAGMPVAVSDWLIP